MPLLLTLRSPKKSIRSPLCATLNTVTRGRAIASEDASKQRRQVQSTAHGRAVNALLTAEALRPGHGRRSRVERLHTVAMFEPARPTYTATLEEIRSSGLYKRERVIT